MISAARGIGWALLSPAIVILVYGSFLWLDGVPLFEVTVQDHWSGADAENLKSVRSFVEYWLHPAIWNPLIVDALRQPVAVALAVAAAVPGLPGLFLVVLFSQRWERSVVRAQYRH